MHFEWGHDFRPEYRQIAALRKHLPCVPFMALTATATGRVRTDIVEQLHMEDARCYVASFNRPNLTYRVVPKEGAYVQTLKFIRARKGECGIVYCFSRKVGGIRRGKARWKMVREAPVLITPGWSDKVPAPKIRAFPARRSAA